MKHFCEFYIRHPRLIGACYCILPVFLAYTVLFAANPFRGVYVLRLVLSLVLGIPLAAYVSEAGLRFWLLKHRSAEGPATVPDGFLIGAGVGLAANFMPPLFAFVATHHPEEAKWLVIVGWGSGVLIGGIVGAILASIGRKYIDRASLANEV